MHKIRVILDTQEDVLRTLLVDSSSNLKEIQKVIVSAFGFNEQEMASFYRTDDEWNQGEEIPLFNISKGGKDTSMISYTLHETLSSIHDKLIYVYDFFSMWTFYVEVIDITTNILDDLPKVILSVGDVPKESPNKEFVADKNFDFDDKEEFKSYFESLDDLDLDSF